MSLVTIGRNSERNKILIYVIKDIETCVNI